MKNILRIVVLALLLIVIGSWQTVVFAGEGANFALKMVPNDATTESAYYYIYEGKPGTTISGQVLVINTGSEIGTANLYAVDTTTGQTGGTVFHLHNEAVEKTGNWIQLNTAEITLGPGENQLVSFTVTIPENIRSGQHVGGIVVEGIGVNEAETATLEQETATFQVEVKTRMAMAVQVNVPGAVVEKIDVTGVYPGGAEGHQALYLGLRNSGTEIVKPKGVLTIADAQGQRLQELNFQIDSFLPETEILYPVFVEGKALPAGSFTADLTLTYGAESQEYNYPLTFNISEAQNTQVFEGREALAAPTTSNSAAAADAPPYWQIFFMGGLGFVDLALVGVLVFLMYQYFRQRKQKQKKQQPNLQTPK